MRHRPADAFATPVEEEEAAYAIALSARRFSRRTQSLVDDKLSFSATLMRAGEVTEANRAMEEFEHDVRGEEAELFRQVSKVRASQRALSRHRPRPLLVRLLATALMGMSLMCVSVAGAAVAGFVANRLAPAPPTGHQESLAVAPETAPRRKPFRMIEVAPGVRVKLDRQQLQTYRQLLSGAPLDVTQLEEILGGLPPNVAAVVRQVLEETGMLSGVEVEVVDGLLEAVQAKKDKAERRASAEAAPAEDDAPSDSQETETADESSESGSGNGTGGGKKKSHDGSTETSLPELPPLPLP